MNSSDPVFQPTKDMDYTSDGHDTNREVRWLDLQWRDRPDGPADLLYLKDWYFWNETWSDCLGPFDTKEEANKACVEYAKAL